MRRFLIAPAAMESIDDRSGKHAHGANQWRACAPVGRSGGRAMNGEVIEGSIKMRCKTLAKLFAVSLVILTSSPALATQLAGGNTTHDDWPANMILG